MMANKKETSRSMVAYMMIVSAMIGIMLFDLQVALFVGMAWAGLLILWHIRHDVDGSLTHSRYLGKVVVGA